MTTAIVWFRRDLRLTDNAALMRALDEATLVIPVYIHAPEEDRDWAPGAASHWWLHHSLKALSESLAQRGSRLIIRRGPSLATLRSLIRETGATRIFFNRLYEPARLMADRAIEQSLIADRIDVWSGAGHLLAEPWSIASLNDAPYRVFTPYAKRLREKLLIATPYPSPRKLPAVTTRLPSLPLQRLQLLPDIRWDLGLAAHWRPGESGAQRRLRKIDRCLSGYSHQRDFPAAEGTTGLSPHLHFGEVSPGQVWQRIAHANREKRPGLARGAETLERELLWREFAHHVLYHFPHTPDAPLDPRFANFPWRHSKKLLAAWRRGETGFPIVDAGMRELWTTGFMHNRVRMITASLLTKHMGIDWRAGARWFWDTLVDADLASNTLNWQWVAGCGADAAPYFRIFNPVLQSEKFDPDGKYIKHWLPELAKLSTRYLHAPHLAPLPVQAAAGLKVGRDYPLPVLDLAEERQAALARYRFVRNRAKPSSGRYSASRSPCESDTPRHGNYF